MRDVAICWHRRWVVSAAVICLALLALPLAAGCGSSGGKSSRSAPTSGSIMGGAIEYTGGVNPVLACTADGWVIEMHEAGYRDKNWYNIGKFDGDDFKWLGKPKGFGPGVEPGVAMTDDGLIVSVHRARDSNGLWYEIGKLDKTSGNYTMLRDSVEYDSGSYPRVVIFNDGTVVETHLSTVGEDSWYKVGLLDTATNNIDFGSSQSIEGPLGLAALKGSNKLVQIRTKGYRFGTVDRASKSVSWAGWKEDIAIGKYTLQKVKYPELKEDRWEDITAVAPCAYLADSGEYRVVFVADAGSILYVGRGYVRDLESDPSFMNTTFKESGHGTQVTFADSSSRAIEMHLNAGPGDKTLWYSTGVY